MRLILFNFRCYTGIHEFTFCDSGITLISGPSGKGKTSILMGLFFVLTGNSPSRVISEGFDTCRVELFYKDCHIIRTRRPNRVIFKSPIGVLEDDVAQEQIDQIFGKHFSITSYIQQQYQKTFLYLSPSDKLELLEQLCFPSDNLNPENLKKKCSEEIKRISLQHSETKGRYQYLLHSMKIIEPPVIIELMKDDVNTLQSILKSLMDKERKIHDNNVLAKKRIEYMELLDNLSKNIKPLKYTMEQINMQYDNLIMRENYTIEETWTKYSKDETKIHISTYEEDISLLKEFKILQQKTSQHTELKITLDKLEAEKIDIESMSQGLYSCPNCSILLTLTRDQLMICSERPSTFLTTEVKKNKLSKLDSCIESIRKQIYKSTEYLDRMEEIRSLVDVDEDILVLESDLLWIKNYFKTNIEIDIKNEINKKKLETCERKLNNHLTLQECKEEKTKIIEQDILKNKISFLLSQIEATNIEPLNISLDEIQEQRDTITKQIESIQKNKHEYELYLIHKEKYETYLLQEKELKKLRSLMLELEEKLLTLNVLKQLVLRTESNVIESKLFNISKNVNSILENIFIEPISVELNTLKKTATTNEKVQVQLDIFYKNMKCDVSMLSGGEQARLNLAFMVAFSKTFESPLLLLDECTSNLDQELTEVVLEQVSSLGIQKIILIAHQIVQGNFDQTIVI